VYPVAQAAQLGWAQPVSQTQDPSAWAVPWPLQVRAWLYWQVLPTYPEAQLPQEGAAQPVSHVHEPSPLALPRLLQVVERPYWQLDPTNPAEQVQEPVALHEPLPEHVEEARQ
jgi:hypothetical protein